MDENFLIKKLDERKKSNSLRQLKLPGARIDFCSNDYLGIAYNNLLDDHLQKHSYKTGSRGSRLLAGNYALIEEVEQKIASFHQAEKALIFNSGYDANLGLFSCLPQRGDTILYDQLSHASIRDGIRLSLGQSFSFRHNDLEDLIKKLKAASGNIFVVTESVFSMDGDKSPLVEMAALCQEYQAHLVVDEAHATGVVGSRGEGLVQALGLQKYCLARIHTFGKACGVHGAAVLGSLNLFNFLINFARPFIFTTALPEMSVAAIGASYDVFPKLISEREQLSRMIDQFQCADIRYTRLLSETPVQVLMIAGNEEVKRQGEKLQEEGFDIRPILYPTVPRGTERLRIVIHSFNTAEQVAHLIRLLQ